MADLVVESNFFQRHSFDCVLLGFDWDLIGILHAFVGACFFLNKYQLLLGLPSFSYLVALDGIVELEEYFFT